MLDYSQHGQALILEQLITPDTPRILVDIGAHDGVTGSNSRALVERGWRAVLVEPLPAVFSRLRENCRPYPDVTLLHAACSDRSGRTVLRLGIDGQEGQLSSLSASAVIAQNLASETIEVPSLTLEDIFAAAAVPADFGALLVDTEGLDLEILKALARTARRPRVIVTEDFVETDSEKYALISTLGYRFVGVWGADSVWISRDHPADTASVRMPVWRLPASWRPSGAPAPGRAYLDGIARQCVVGWAFGDADRTPSSEVAVELRRPGAPQRYVFRAARVPRADVAAHFGSPALWMSGFRACIDVPPGDYDLRVIQQEDGAFREAALGPVSIA